ncbi:MAG TPA: hypothetical protein VHR45_20090 [Thermoanaerobaculia bacterium]|nr:hypothetical protein [Thermoanaerobaculia bacterium]
MRKNSLWMLKLGGDEWTAVFMAASGLIWTVAAYRSIPDVALGFGQYGGKGFSGSSWPVPADHGAGPSASVGCR